MPYVVMTDPQDREERQTLSRRPHRTLTRAMQAARRSARERSARVAVVWLDDAGIPKVWMAYVYAGPGGLLGTEYTESGGKEIAREGLTP